jgi:hypothetical protein
MYNRKRTDAHFRTPRLRLQRPRKLLETFHAGPTCSAAIGCVVLGSSQSPGQWKHVCTLMLLDDLIYTSCSRTCAHILTPFRLYYRYLDYLHGRPTPHLCFFYKRPLGRLQAGRSAIIAASKLACENTAVVGLLTSTLIKMIVLFT